MREGVGGYSVVIVANGVKVASRLIRVEVSLGATDTVG